jgi:uncharacterized phage protein (TIGR01671 family)
MRDILFRGKRTDNGEWTYGSPIFQDGYVLIRFWNSEEFEFEEYLVSPESVSAFTGLTDKNGKKIFEGDIVSTDIKRPYLIVEFRDGCFMFNCNDGGEDYYDIMLPICKEPHEEYRYGEIIGNIHDNPELLKGGVNNA